MGGDVEVEAEGGGEDGEIEGLVRMDVDVNVVFWLDVARLSADGMEFRVVDGGIAVILVRDHSGAEAVESGGRSDRPDRSVCSFATGISNLTRSVADVLVFTKSISCRTSSGAADKALLRSPLILAASTFCSPDFMMLFIMPT